MGNSVKTLIRYTTIKKKEKSIEMKSNKSITGWLALGQIIYLSIV